MTYIYNQVPKLAVKNLPSEAATTHAEATEKDDTTAPTGQSPTKKYIFHDFINSGCCGMMVAYSFLYLTVLSFGSLMIVYLRWVRYSFILFPLVY